MNERMDKWIEATNDLTSVKFYDGTKASFNTGGLIETGVSSNYGKKKKAKYIVALTLIDDVFNQANEFDYFLKKL